MTPQIMCIRAPCDFAPSPTLPATSYPVIDLMPLPPTLPMAPTYTPGLGQELPNGDPLPMFSTSTNELDRYRILFLIVGVVIGAMFLSRA